VSMPGDKGRLRWPEPGIAAYMSRLRKPHHNGRVGTADRQTSRQGMTEELRMAATAYHVALAFMRSEDGDAVACEPKEARSSDQAIRMAGLLAMTEEYCGAIALVDAYGERFVGVGAQLNHRELQRSGGGLHRGDVFGLEP
jgi:hypothetical protein